MDRSGWPQTDRDFVVRIEKLAALFALRAEETDQAGPMNDLLGSNIHQLAVAGFFGAGVKAEYGGLGISVDARRECLQLLAAACGVTAFTQQQLHGGAGFVGGSEQEELKRTLLPKMANGKLLCGVGFSHLRRPGKPAVIATSDGADGFVVNGIAPWVTPWTMLNAFILGATIDDGRVLFAYVPTGEFRNCLEPSPPIRLSAMDSSDTVSVGIKGLHLPNKYVLFINGADHMAENDFRGITGHVDLPLGCARGSVGLLRDLAVRRSRQDLADLADFFLRQIQQCETDARLWNGSRADEPDYQANALRQRTTAINLALRAAEAGVVASGGSAHLRTNPAQRRMREASFYSTAAQTKDVQMNFLEELKHA